MHSKQHKVWAEGKIHKVCVWVAKTVEDRWEDKMKDLRMELEVHWSALRVLEETETHNLS